MRVLVSGATGLIGSALVPFLEKEGHEVVRLVRASPRPGSDDVAWDPAAGRLEPGRLEGLDAVVHLAGENISEGRWTAEKKARIRDSRVKGTTLLCEALARLERPPAVLANASAIGYYGDRGDEALTEESPPGTDFLAGVCQQWEAATRPAAEKGIRVVRTRFGLVLSPAGGVLGGMLPHFRRGMGGSLGSGQQWVSWVAIDDAVGAIHHALATTALEGPANVTAPGPVRNREFAETLARAVGKSTLFPVPAVALRLAFGELTEAMLASQRVEPRKLIATGYSFQYPVLQRALEHLLRPAGC
jgi:uncharacterized protein (TIGR01777 family)